MEQIVKDLMEQNREINEKIDLLTEENDELKQLSLCQISKVGKSKNISNIRNTNNKTNCNNDITNNTNTQNNILNDIHDNMITNNNNNQYLVNFGSEDISKLTDAEVLGSLKMLSNVLPHFVKTLHANKRLPEYSNVQIPNAKSNRGLMLEDGIFITKTLNKIIEELLNVRIPDLPSIENA